MHKRFILLFTFLGAATSLFAQTRLIAHKSHSGSMTDFELVLRDEPVASVNENFGVVGDEPELVVELDSVIRVNDSTSVMIIRSANLYTYKKESRKVASYRDTVHHPALRGERTIEAVKKNIVNYSGNNFSNPIDSAKFIGFDTYQQEIPKKKKKNTLFPVVFDGGPDLPLSALPSLVLLGVLACISVAVGLVYSRYSKLKQSM